jgi:hypothetical protein
MKDSGSTKVIGYLPEDKPPIGAMLSLGLQQVLTMFPATVLVAYLTKFDVGVTLLASGLGTIIALLVTKRRIPMYYGSSFSYISVVITVMNLYAKDCFTNSAISYCPEGVKLVQVGILGTAVVEILIGLLIMRVGKKALDHVLPPVITGSVAIVIGVALAYEAIKMAAGAAVGGAVDCYHHVLGVFTRQRAVRDAADPARGDFRLSLCFALPGHGEFPTGPHGRLAAYSKVHFPGVHRSKCMGHGLQHCLDRDCHHPRIDCSPLPDEPVYRQIGSRIEARADRNQEADRFEPGCRWL